ncbi:isopenicillin N synthase family oxygenase [Paucibacter sp. TC2R-5]|uniref:isopenicillin N synthase family dioxygenase n=1 Tax=Paucibacter sp. TC2R-5 TaxID=2893555 RepID=UPI0021E3CDF6|nr:2-oxoglutarate and iron-dependent oxygenase domain-containing protein [Paucibacter sp. TC2R-5]MCV2361292.1 isopenicillin N synthase family oxygenase [Paucibacter sp. TC2R-5]
MSSLMATSDAPIVLPSESTGGSMNMSLQAESELALALPVLDLRDLTDTSPAAQLRFVNRLREVSHTLGFFYLRGHGVPSAKVAQVFRLSRAFFNLPREQKLAVHMAGSPHFRGYTAAGEEITQGARDWREQLDIGAERPSLPGAQADEAWQRLQGPNQWPQQIPELKPALLAWQGRLTFVAQQLLDALALALHQPPDCFDEAFALEPVQHLKIIRYPGRSEPGAGPQGQGVGAHKDSGCLTLLQQDACGGLQIKNDGRWIDVPPQPDTLVVNLGEVLEMLTGGYLRATLHRVVSPPLGVDSLSAAFFLGPRLDAELPDLKLPPALALRARGVELDPANPLIRHAGRNFLKGRLRSHPEVAQAFYADVLSLEA